MENVWNTIRETLSTYDNIIDKIPLFKIFIVVIILTFTQIFRNFFSTLIIHRIERLTSGTSTHIDDELIKILKQPLNWLIFIAGLSIIHLILAEDFSSNLNEKISNFLTFLVIATLAYIIYYAAPLLGELLQQLTLKTQTELDDLIVPYLPNLFRVIAVVIIVLKASEVFLGASAGALIGLLGGAGVAVGLLLKDLIYDSVCTIIIYTDSLFRAGDIVSVQGIDDLIRVDHVGIRSTTLTLLTKNAIKKMPNSQMINGVIENWTQSVNDEKSITISLNLQIDDISAEQTTRICGYLREIPKVIDTLEEKSFVWFSGLTQNARIIKINVFAKVNEIDAYYGTIEKINLEILKILEKEELKFLSTSPVELITSSGGEIKNNLEPIKN